jgi:uncharacterized membrane protein YjgN (DUF898 family)
MEKEKEIHLIHYLGKRRALVGRYMKLLLFFILTLSIYTGWGVTKVRRYMAQHVQIGGHRFAYSGKGHHLFFGVALGDMAHKLLKFLLKFVPNVLVGYDPDDMFHDLFKILISIIWYLICYELYLYFSWRYVLARLSWRGIRGCFQGAWWRYLFLYTYRTCLNILSLTLLMPWSDLVKYRYRMNRSYFGNSPLSFQFVSIKKLARTHLKTLLLFPLTLGLSRLWYQAALRNYQWNHTVVGNLHFRSTYTGWGLCKLYIGNSFLLVVPLAWPFIVCYFLDTFRSGTGVHVVGFIFVLCVFLACFSGLIAIAVHRNTRYKAQHTAVLGDLELFFETQKETLSAEPVELLSIGFGSEFLISPMFPI